LKIFVLAAIFPHTFLWGNILTELESKFDVKLASTSYFVEQVYRASLTSTLEALIEEQMKSSAVENAERVAISRSAILDFKRLDTQFLKVAKAIEEMGGDLYLAVPDDDSVLTGYEFVYVAVIDGEVYAFTEGDALEDILRRKNGDYYPKSQINTWAIKQVTGH